MHDCLIDDVLRVEEITPGYPIFHIRNASATAQIALHGAHLIAYTPYGKTDQPVIFTSSQAAYKVGKAIRGGIPLCWPWFSAHPSDSSQPSHGHARNQFWTSLSSSTTQRETKLALQLEHNELQAIVHFTIGEQLRISLTTTNRSREAQRIGGALHSYFHVGDIAQVTLSGLENSTYFDAITKDTKTQNGQLTIGSAVDSIYHPTDAAITIHDHALDREIVVEKAGSQSTVIWNPWAEGAASMGDLADEEYQQFVCVETANTQFDMIELAPQQSHTLATTISIR